MANKIGSKHSFIPWLRRGLSREISNGEVDTLAKDSNEGSAIKRASLFVKSTFDLTPIDKESDNKGIVQRSETIQVALTGPGDIAGIQPVSILQVVPANGVKNFESNYLPFIEFFEEDIPWRYTPAKEAGDKLRPWLALLVCKNDEFALTTDNNGSTYVSIKVSNNEAYKQIFQSPSETWKNAHVHFPNLELEKDKPLINAVNSKIDHDENVAFSRLLSSRVLEDNTAYTAFLIPAFETGRLSGLMLSFDEIPAQRSSWDATFDKQKATRQRPLDFPVYYRWEFETSTGDFVALAKRLKPVSTDNLPAALKVDVQRMGNGLNYSIFQNQPTRKVIDVPVATHPIGYDVSEPFPSRPDEQMIANIMKDLLSKNPVLIENMEQTAEEQPISRKNKKQKIKQKQIRVNVKKRDLRKILTAKTAIDLSIYDKISVAKNLGTLLNDEFKKKSLSLDVNAGDEIDDPWIVPSLYGGKHIMATSLETNDNKKHEWFTQLNLDIRHRAAAGMGKKVVQNNQEQFVHRAWEQVELINELNQRLREYLLKLNLNSSIYKSRFNSKYLKDLMLYLQPMKYALVGKDNLSLDEALAQRGIPSAYASSSFQRLTSNTSLPENVNATTLTEKIVENNIYKWEEHQIKDLITEEQIMDKICGCYFLIVYKFQIHKMKCHKIEKDEPYDNLYFKLIPDKDYLKEKIFYKLKEGMSLNEQVIEFVGEDEISIIFKKEIEVSVGRYLYYTSEEEGNNVFIPTGNSSGSFRVDINKRNAHKTFSYLNIEYEISKIIKGRNVEGAEFSWEFLSDYENLNVEFYSKKIKNADKKLAEIFDKVKPQETTQSKPDDKISPQLNTDINPFNSEENDRINQFITEYYQEFLSNPVLQDKYIKELTHSQYPVMAYPVYPEPAYYYLKQISERFILPASGSMPDNSIALFVNNTAFVEAFLCGMNTEMGRELLWREYPTDSRGSYFRKFWDTEIKKDIKEELRSDTFFDILPIHKWEYQEGDMPLKTHKLGQNHTAGKDNLLIFAIKGELLKKYPETIIYLSKASLNGNKILINPDAVKILPDLSAWLSEDTYIVGFPAKLDELTGNPATKDPGYFLTFMNRPGETRFASRKDNPAKAVSNAAETAANLLVQPSMFGKHVSQFLSGWQNAPQK